MTAKKFLYNFLEENLVLNMETPHKFSKLGPNSLIFSDDVDKIVIYLNDKDMIIIHDGDHVIDSIETIKISPFIDSIVDNADGKISEHMENFINLRYLQPVLHKF